MSRAINRTEGKAANIGYVYNCTVVCVLCGKAELSVSFFANLIWEKPKVHSSSSSSFFAAMFGVSVTPTWPG